MDAMRGADALDLGCLSVKRVPAESDLGTFCLRRQLLSILDVSPRLDALNRSSQYSSKDSITRATKRYVK